MARAATTADAFNAVAEPRRREILDLLAGGERPVNDLVALLGLAQPLGSNHLRGPREVGLVEGPWDGPMHKYPLVSRPLYPTHLSTTPSHPAPSPILHLTTALTAT